MHLTNYAINKNSDQFEANKNKADDHKGHKRSVSSVFKEIEYIEEGMVTTESLWQKIDDIVVLTLISAQPKILKDVKEKQPYDRSNSMFFQIFGFDIFLD